MSRPQIDAFWTRLNEVITDTELRDALIEWVAAQTELAPDIPVESIRLLGAYVMATETDLEHTA